jgi:hypothetical protein
MRERLPRISIAIKSTHCNVVSQLYTIANDNQDLNAELHPDVAGDECDILSLHPNFSTPHEDLLASLIFTPGSITRLDVEISAKNLSPDPPTYDSYVEAASQLLKPLLSLYNKKYGRHIRLTIQSKESLQPRLPPRALNAFNLFTLAANKHSLHPLDWERFYTFIYFCSPRNINVNRDDVKRLLLSSGFDSEYSDRLAEIYDHGIALLRHIRT